MVYDTVKVKILQYGDLPEIVNYDYIQSFKSSLFEVVSYEKFPLPNVQNGFDYCTYLDNAWSELIKPTDNMLTLVLTNTLLADNHYARHLSNYRIIFSFSLIYQQLIDAHISLENVILKALYEYALIFETDALKNGYSYTGIWHNETRGCLFDIDGKLEDIAITCKKPHICDVCRGELLQSGISMDKLSAADKELKKLKVRWVYRLLNWVEKHPIWSIFITFTFSVMSNITSSFLYDALKNILN
jgi:hypothetical protein